MHTFDEQSQSAAAALRQDLSAASFNHHTLLELFGAENWHAFTAQDPMPLRLVVAEHPEVVLNQLTAFFVLGQPLTGAQLATLLPGYSAFGDPLDLFAPDVPTKQYAEPAMLHPTLTIRPFAFDVAPEEGWLLASDLDERTKPGTALRPDHVLGLGGAAQTMAALFGAKHDLGDPMPAAPELAKAWDLGCGCGVLSLRLSRFVDRVIATDVSVRALWFTDLNAALNGVTNIETRLGSLADPVRDERFGLIVSNPPFVITPRELDDENFEYRDGGLAGDELMREATTAVANHLAPGGSGFLLGNWEHYRDGSDADAWGRIVAAAEHPESNSIDVWLIERERITPLAYAQMWIRDGGVNLSSERYPELLSAWLHDFSSRDVSAVGFGWVLLQAPDAANSTALAPRCEMLTQSVDYVSLASALAAGMQLRRFLADCSDDELLSWTLLASSDVIEARYLEPGLDEPRIIELRQGSGLRLVESVTPTAAALVGASDGELRVGAIADALAQIWELPPEQMRQDVAAEARMLLLHGFLRFSF